MLFFRIWFVRNVSRVWKTIKDLWEAHLDNTLKYWKIANGCPETQLSYVVFLNSVSVFCLFTEFFLVKVK